MAPILQLDNLLHLGVVDEDSFDTFQQNRTSYFNKYHQRFWDHFGNQSRRRRQFRGEATSEWIEPRKIPGNDVKALQTFLHKHGFMPGARIDGVFDYWTLSSVRLFQEYVRTVEGKKDFGIADGRVWKGTHNEMMRWQENDLYCAWGPDRSTDPQKEFTWSNPSKEYDLWMSLLPKVKQNYLQALQNTDRPDEQLELYQLNEVRRFPRKTDSIKIEDWSYNRDDIHLIGLRCFQEKSAKKRGNDDLLVLLMNGMVFKFWGSTDPKPSRTDSSATKKRDGFEPYLVEGQHKYGLSWHKVSTDAGNNVYQALVPYQRGVLVFRDWSKTDSLNEEDIRQGLLYNKYKAKNRYNPNQAINIHWTGDGTNNWSAGCQVISGRSYINHDGDLIDCSDFSARGYKAISWISRSGVKKNKGAYTFLADFVFVYSRPGQDHVLYTLGRDGAVEQFADSVLLEELKKQVPGKNFDSDTGGEELVQAMVARMKDLV